MYSLYVNPETDDLTVTRESDGKGWVALVEGTHPEYRFQRSFIDYHRAGERQRTTTETLAEGDVIERADTESDRRYYVYRDGDLVQIEAEAVEDALLRGRESPV